MSFLLDDYDFVLPPERIAQCPAEPRDCSRLLVIDRKKGTWEHRSFRDLPEYMDSRDHLVANNTEVLKARLQGHRIPAEGVPAQGLGGAVGGKVEFLMLEEVEPKVWEGAFHAAAKHKPGVRFRIPTPDGLGLVGVLVRGASQSESGTVVARFDRDPIESGAGELPLPHYIDRATESSDTTRYQTVYAKEKGSAAAPTAGLHFTEAVLRELRSRGAEWEEITLHVGLGTFRPVKTPDVRSHVMHEERYSVGAEVASRLNEAKKHGDRIVAVGTTAVRTLESAWREGAGIVAGPGRTKVFIYPEARGQGVPLFQVVDRLITNFHLPKSTLLMLVCAFAGRELVLEAYREAVRKEYRFFSFGDAMLII